MPWSMIGNDGQRKYLTRKELQSFVQASKARDDVIHTFCWIIAATGCRISEALSLTTDSIDFEEGSVVIRCLKKREKRIFRAVPIPASLLRQLKKLVSQSDTHGERLWAWSRMTGYRRICEVMEMAGIRGPYASPKGLRHAFGVNAIQSGVPLNLVQRWLGHADIKTTAIYTSALGDEERAIAARMWSNRTYERPAHSQPVEKRDEISPMEPEVASINDVIECLKRTTSASELRELVPTATLLQKTAWQLRQFWLFRRNECDCFSKSYSLGSRLPPLDSSWSPCGWEPSSLKADGMRRMPRELVPGAS